VTLTKVWNYARMSYRIEIRPEALEDLNSLDSAVAVRILRKLEWLRENFSLITPEPLKGEFKGLFKLRIGDYRKDMEVITDEYSD